MCTYMTSPSAIKTDLRNLTRQELSVFVENIGLSRFRANQIFSWLFRPGISSFEKMTDLSLKLRDSLNSIAAMSELTLARRENSRDGTVKYAFSLADGNIIESVLIPDDGRNTLCVSSQVGCAMGCKFCKTGTIGFRRNLLAAEIVNQVRHVYDELAVTKDSAVHNLVFMGMGEPLANFDNLMKSLDILLDQRGLNFSERKITVSTCGIIPKIIELGQKSNVSLALSLHASSEDVRSRLMPVNDTYSLTSLLETCKKLPIPKRKRIMIEYVMLAGVNDSVEDAKKLAKILRGIPCKINLLPFNPCPQIPFQPTGAEQLERFQDILRKADYTVLVRESRGSDISAACGQLAGKKM